MNLATRSLSPDIFWSSLVFTVSAVTSIFSSTITSSLVALLSTSPMSTPPSWWNRMVSISLVE